jgi:endoglucanase
VIEQQGAIFAYARLPGDRGVSVLKAQARRAILETADVAIAFAEGNAFGLTTEIPQLPEIGPVGYFTVPGMISRSVPRAHYLSGDPKYLAAVVRSCNFSAGANPDNLTFTTGVGHRWPRNPLHIDSRMSGQEAPEGLTVYGASDPARNDASSAWVHAWVLRGVMTPESRTWPATEAYVDLYLWPMMNEFTIHQTLGPTSYAWGYLAARKTR